LERYSGKSKEQMPEKLGSFGKIGAED